MRCLGLAISIMSGGPTLLAKRPKGGEKVNNNNKKPPSQFQIFLSQL